MDGLPRKGKNYLAQINPTRFNISSDIFLAQLSRKFVNLTGKMAKPHAEQCYTWSQLIIFFLIQEKQILYE